MPGAPQTAGLSKAILEKIQNRYKRQVQAQGAAHANHHNGQKQQHTTKSHKAHRGQASPSPAYGQEMSGEQYQEYGNEVYGSQAYGGHAYNYQYQSGGQNRTHAKGHHRGRRAGLSNGPKGKFYLGLNCACSPHLLHNISNNAQRN